MFSEFLLFAITVALCFYLWQRHAHSFWQRHNVKFIRPSAFFGNFRDLFLVRKSFPAVLWQLHADASLEHDEPLVGIYNCYRPALLVRDVELIKRIMIKDFNEFTNRVVQADPHHDPLGNNNLFFARSPKWRELRSKLSPVFTSGKIKQMYPLMTEVGRELESLLRTYTSDSVVDIKEICSRFTNEMIGTIAFGIRAGSLRDRNSAFYRHSIAIFELTISRAIDFACLLLLPTLTSLLRVKLFSAKTSKFMHDSVTHIMAERERTRVQRNDLIDTLIAMKQEAQADSDKSNPARDVDFLVAQAAVFQTAGFETSSSTMTFTLYELALHPEMQERLRAEIRDAYVEMDNACSEISYERLQQLPYLGQVVDETLRKYPIVGFLERQCQPIAAKTGYSLSPYSDFNVPAGMALYVAPLGVQHDERYWPEPEKFDPERFAPENRKNLNMNAYLPFGIGPRNCIGMRIGLLQTKLGLAHLLKDYRVLPSARTPDKIELDPRTVVLTSKNGVYLKLERVEN